MKSRKVKYGQGDYLLTCYSAVGQKISKHLYPSYSSATEAGKELTEGSFMVSLIMFNSLEPSKEKWDDK